MKKFIKVHAWEIFFGSGFLLAVYWGVPLLFRESPSVFEPIEGERKMPFNSGTLTFTRDTSYEKYKKYEQCEKRFTGAKTKMAVLQKRTTSGPEYDSLSREIAGILREKNGIVASYNGMSHFSWDTSWESKGLPKVLALE